MPELLYIENLLVKLLYQSEFKFAKELLEKKRHIFSRGDYSCLDDYIFSINNLKEKYKKDINIYVGFEAEYFPPYIDYYKELIESNKIDYLILGQHFDWTIDNKIGTSFFDCHTRSEINKYLETVTKAMESGLFSIFAHPDICFVGYENEWEMSEM